MRSAVFSCCTEKAQVKVARVQDNIHHSGMWDGVVYTYIPLLGPPCHFTLLHKLTKKRQNDILEGFML